MSVPLLSLPPKAYLIMMLKRGYHAFTKWAQEKHSAYIGDVFDLERQESIMAARFSVPVVAQPKTIAAPLREAIIKEKAKPFGERIFQFRMYDTVVFYDDFMIRVLALSSLVRLTEDA